MFSPDRIPGPGEESERTLDTVLSPDRIPGLREEVEVLSERDRMGEFMWLGLRRTAGVSEAQFRDEFHKDIDDVFGSIIGGHVRHGLLERVDGRIRLTEYGTDISNYVMCDFV